MSSKKLTDPITVEVIRNSLQSAVDEMGLTITKLAHSLIFAESKDFSVAILSADAELVALAQYIPVHQGGMQSNLEAVLRIIGKDNLFPGDVVMTNDPYLGGLHALDVTLLAPIFYDGQIVAYGGCVAHRTDIGGMTPGGYCPTATDCYQEGIRFPAIKLVERGKIREDILRIYLTNVRLPDDQLADTQAQLAALRGCERAVRRIIDKYGVQTFLASVKEILDLSERRGRAEVEKIPDGVYTFTDYDEGDGFTDRDWKVQVTMKKRGSDIYLDFTGSDEQAKGPINLAAYITMADAWVALMFWVDPTIPKNQGLYRLFKKIYVPKGTILNANHPAPMSRGAGGLGGIVLDCVLGVLSEADPERGIGGWEASTMAATFVGYNPETGKRFGQLTMDGMALGGGARSFADGWLAGKLSGSHMLTTSAEIWEQNLPFRVLRRELITDGGGDGKFRGGPGMLIEYEVLAPVELNVMINRQRHPPRGFAGGTAGGPSGVSIISGGQERILPQKAASILKKGDIFRLRCCGGGGYGKPEDRDPELVKDDVRNGIISLEKARRVYGFKGEID